MPQEKLLQGIDPTLINSSGNLVNGSSITTTVNGDYIFPFIIVQSGLINNTSIGSDISNTGNFTSLTASTLTVFDAIIQLGQPTALRHGLLFGNNQFFGIGSNNALTYQMNGVLGPAQFSQIQFGNGSAFISGTNNILNLNSTGIVNLPVGTQAYRPTIERVQVVLSNTSPSITNVVLNSLINMSFVDIVTTETLNTIKKVEFQLMDSIYDGFIKQIRIVHCDTPSMIQIHLPLILTCPETSGAQIIEFYPGTTISLGYDLNLLKWYFIDTGCGLLL